MFFSKNKLIEIKDQKLIKKSPWPKVIAMLSISVLVIYLFWRTHPNFDWKIFQNTVKYFGDFDTIKLGFNNEITIADTLIRSLSLLVDTLAFSVLGTLIGLLVAIPLSLLSSRNVTKSAWIYQPVRFIVSIIRSIPPLIYAYILFFAFDGPLSASISLALFVSSITTKWLYEWLDTTDFETYESLISMGLSKPRAILKAIMPELMKKVVSYGLYAFEMVIRFATILSVVGIQTIGYLMSNTYKQPDRWGHLLIVIVVLVITIVIIEVITIVIKRYILEPKLKQANLNKKEKLEKQIISLTKQRSKSHIWQKISLVLLLGIIIFSLTRINFAMAPSGRLIQFKDGIGKLFTPEWEIITNFNSINAILLSLEALLVATVAAVLGAILGLIFGILASRNIFNKYFAWFNKILIIITRSIPTFVYAFIFVLSAYENKIWVGVLAMGIRSIGMLGKLTYEKIETTDLGGKLSMDVMGNNTYNSTRIAVISEAMPAIISNMLYRIEINFKSVVEIGAVGASTLGFQIQVNSEPSRFSYLSPYIITMIVFVLLIEQISSILRKRIMTGYWISSNNFIKKWQRKRINALALQKAVVRKVPLPKTLISKKYLILETNLMTKKDKQLLEKWNIKSNLVSNYLNDSYNENLKKIEEEIIFESNKISQSIKNGNYDKSSIQISKNKLKKMKLNKKRISYKHAYQETVHKFI